MPFSDVDETINCNGCGLPFLFSIGEKQFFTTQGYDKPPKKCQNCRKQKRERNNGGYNTTGGYSAGGSYSPPSAPAAPFVNQAKPAPSYDDDAPKRDRDRKSKRRNRDDDDYEY